MDHRTYRERIEQKLTAAFSPKHLEIVDESARHQGHAGHLPGGETHFKINLVTDAFKGLSAVARHRLIYSTLAEELKERVHALAIEASDCMEAGDKNKRL